MQNLFQTLKQCPTKESNPKSEKSAASVDFNDFSTMQHLFATNFNFQTKV